MVSPLKMTFLSGSNDFHQRRGVEPSTLDFVAIFLLTITNLTIRRVIALGATSRLTWPVQVVPGC